MTKRKSWQTTVLLLGIALLLGVAIEYWSFGLAGIDWYVPLMYGADGITGVRDVTDTLYDTSALLGWPYHEAATAYTPNYRFLYTGFVAVCRLFLHDAGPIFNLYILAIPLLNVAVCLLVLRSLKVRGWLAVLGSLTLGLCPYVQQRLTEGHMALASIECFPLLLLLCFWCAEDERFQRLGKGFFRYRRNLLAILFGWMIANNGMVYYPFFSCFVLCLLGLCLLLRTRRAQSLLKPLLCIAEIAFWLVLVFVPLLFLPGAFAGTTHGAVRDAVGVDVYGLRITSLLLSPHGYGISAVADFINNLLAGYKANAGALVNENAYGYLGIVGIAGFLGLLGLLFAGQPKAEPNDALPGRLWLLSRLNVGVLLLAVYAGFGTLVGILVPYIRTYNRMSGLLACLTIFAALLWLDGRLPRGKTPKAVAVCTVAALVLIYGLWEQQRFFRPDTEKLKATWVQDEAFVWQIEQYSGEDALIYQLPYMRSFENGPVKKMADYTLLRGVLHSDTLRWSYGGDNGGENDAWNLAISQMEPAEMVATLKEQGFAGIWVDGDGYTEEAGDALRAQLISETGCDSPVMSENGKLCYIYF